MASIRPILVAALLAGLSAPAGAAQSVTVSSLIDVFLEACQTPTLSFQNSRDVLWRKGWRVSEHRNTDAFVGSEFQNKDGSLYAYLQHYDFGPGLSDECGVTAKTVLKEEDVRLVLQHFPNATGKILRVSDDQFSGLYLLTDQKQFTSLNIISTRDYARIVTVRTTYSAPKM